VRPKVRQFLSVIIIGAIGQACASSAPATPPAFTPTEVIDLGALVTPDLPQKLWGKAFMKQMGFNRQNTFDVVSWKFPAGKDTISGSNGYYTLFNHGGPHVDAPNHFGAGKGIDSYAIASFAGSLKVFDATSYPIGRSVPVELFRGHVQPGDIVLIYTKYVPPQTDDAQPELRTLTHEAAEFLATLPVRAYGTDAFSVESNADLSTPMIHQTFLTRGIPLYEQLFNVDKLLGKTRMYFVGTPLNIKDGDGMMVRPVVLVY